MIQVNVISKVDIPVINEEIIAALIKAEINRTNPEIVVNDILFERKLNPQRIEATVDAHLGINAPVIATVVAEVQADLPFETPVVKKDEPIVLQEIKPTQSASAETVADIFNN